MINLADTLERMSADDDLTLLQSLEIDQIWFVRDHVRIGLSDYWIDCLDGPIVTVGGVPHRFPELGSHEALWSLIDKTVAFATLDETKALKLELTDGSSIEVPLDGDLPFSERIVIGGGPEKIIWPIDAVASVRRIKLAHPLIEEDELRAVALALSSGQLAQGPRVAAFEAEFAAYVGVKHAVAVNSGTAALHVALLAHGIGSMSRGGSPDDEVIVPAFSFAATANCALQAGARLVFVDVREHDFNIDTDAIAAAITPRTRAVIGVHLYGQMCDTDALSATCERNGIALIEDAAQAVGSTLNGRNAGSIGAGCFSFYATKNLTTGEGGMLTTNDDAIAERARTLRSQGERTRYVTEELGWNYRMTEPAAALGSVQLRKLDAQNERRRANAARLNDLLRNVGGIATPTDLDGRHHVWHQYTIRVTAGREARGAMQAGLREKGIESAVFYPTPIHKQPLYQRLGLGGAELPVAQRLSDEVLSLPVHPGLSDQDIESIAAAVREIAR